MRTVIEDLKLEKFWVVYPGKESYQLDEKIFVQSFDDFNRPI